jgi:hypothetical protein
VRNIPPRRNLANVFDYSSSSRTGGRERRREEDEALSPEKYHNAQASDNLSGKAPMATEVTSRKGGTYVRKVRKDPVQPVQDKPHVPLGTGSRKRRTKQVWLPVPVQVVGAESSGSAGKRQRTNSVFDRIEDPAGGQGTRVTTSVFDRIEETSADPAWQGRRGQSIL